MGPNDIDFTNMLGGANGPLVQRPAPVMGRELWGAPGDLIGAPTPGTDSKGWFGVNGLGKNLDTLKLGASGIQTLAGLWAAMQSMKMAKKQYAFTRATTNANLANQTQSYNTSIEDRARARGIAEGQTSAQVDDYISKNSLAKRTV
jgi:hypothetical protein